MAAQHAPVEQQTNSDIRKAMQQGAARPDVVAGLVFSIVANYLNRVVGNRTVGEHIVLQGGVAKNPAVPLAFAQKTGRPILVPPDPELMGCFGVARLVLQKHDEGLIEKGDFDLEALILAGFDFQLGPNARAAIAMSAAKSDFYSAGIEYDLPILQRRFFPYTVVTGGIFTQKSDGDVIQLEFQGDVPPANRLPARS